MKAPLQVCGSISKQETLSQIKTNIIPDTFVAEAPFPYASYYGGFPENGKPNSIFLFTRKFHFLEELLDLKKGTQNCLLEELNIANALIDINDKQYPAVRIKFFPDYKRIPDLQECFLKQGIKFSTPIHLNGSYHANIHKLFKLDEVGEGLYLDFIEVNKGYFAIDRSFSPAIFNDIQNDIRNNSSCHLFDAEQGMILLHGKVQHIVRVFAEGIGLTLIKCIQKEFTSRLAKFAALATERL